MEKGVGDYQIRKAQTSEKQILEILSDGEWHRYQEIQKITRLSTATLSKHLKRLEKSLIEKRLDLETGTYPYPVYYRLRPEVFPKIKPFKPDFTENYGLIRYDLHLLSMFLNSTTLEFLKLYFENPKENEEMFNEAIKHYVLSKHQEAIYTLKELLQKRLEKGEDIQKLLSTELEKLINEYHSFLKNAVKKEKIKRGE